MIIVRNVRPDIIERSLESQLARVSSEASIRITPVDAETQGHFFNIHVTHSLREAERAKGFYQSISDALKSLEEEHSSRTATGGLTVTVMPVGKIDHLIALSHSQKEVVEKIRAALMHLSTS